MDILAAPAFRPVLQQAPQENDFPPGFPPLRMEMRDFDTLPLSFPMAWEVGKCLGEGR